MRSERWQSVRALFDRALDVPPSHRAAWLAQHCDDAELRREVAALLAHAEVPDPSPAADSGPAGRPAGGLAGRRLGGFTLLRLLGAGGMGAVYEAQQERPHRRVALKTLGLGFASERARRRFADEVEILAQLRHPNIAQVLEAGSYRDGDLELPWFAMELVEQPRTLEAYVRQERLPPAAVAALFQPVCDAVHFAHQRGVIHRDLKPANILVDAAGRPKVIDFGIARVLTGGSASPTLTGEVLGTLAYLSPERLSEGGGAADTAADVYSLGVVLYELLAGRRPHELDGLPPARALAVLQQVEPPPPSAVAAEAGIPRELDWICARALEREPHRRYPSAADLAADLQRFRRGEVLAAGPPSTSYRLRVLARRHRAALAAVVACLLAVVAGAVVALVGWRRTAAAEQHARQQAAVLEEVNQFQSSILRGTYSHVRGRDVRLAEVVEAAARELDGRAIGDPATEVGLRTAVGISHLGLGLVNEAEQQFRRCLELATRHGMDPAGGAVIALRNNLGRCLEEMGQLEPAAIELRASLAGRVALYGPDHAETAIAQHNLAGVLHKLGQHAAALDLATAAWRTFLAGHGAGSREAITARTAMALALAGLGRAADADAAFTEAIGLARAHLHPDHPATLATASAYAAHLRRLGRTADFVAAMAEVAAARERLLGPSHPDTWVAWNNLAVGHQDLGDFAAAEPLLRRINAARAQAGITGGFDVRATAQNLTVVVRRQGRLDEAEALARDNRERAAAELPGGHWLQGVTAKEHGACLRQLGRHEAAEAALLAAFHLLEPAVGIADFRTQKVVGELVQLYQDWRRPEDAGRWQQRLLAAGGR